MKRTYPRDFSTKEQRFAKIAANPNSLAYRNQRQMVLYKQPIMRRNTYIPSQDLPEKKFFDTLINFNFDATAEVPATGQLALIPQGDTESTRDGRQCNVLSVQGRLLWTYAPAALATATTSCFLYLIQDTQANGAAAVATDIFTSTNAGIALHNLSNSQRFITLKKWKKTFNPQAGVSAAYNNVTHSMEFFKKIDMKMEFQGATGAITEIRSNNVFLYAGSDTLSDDTVSCSGFIRLRFRG